MLRVVHSLGGCGGTLLSRCLGVLPRTALLSEINPLSVNFFPELNPLTQDAAWLHLLTAAEREHFSHVDLAQPANFRRIIEALRKRAEEAGRILILRDYNYAEFIGAPFLSEPPMRRILCDVLGDGAGIRAIALVRHPIDQWSSLRKHMTVRRAALSPREFCHAYTMFARDLGEVPVFRYEDFVADPTAEMQRICDCLDLPYDSAFRSNQGTFTSVTGDLRRNSDGTIALGERRTVPKETSSEFESDPDLAACAERWGYRESAPGRKFGSGTRAPLEQMLRRQVQELRQASAEWIAESNAKEAEIRALSAEAERRLLELERAVSMIRHREAAKPSWLRTPLRAIRGNSRLFRGGEFS